jgi:hypothetical protein
MTSLQALARSIAADVLSQIDPTGIELPLRDELLIELDALRDALVGEAPAEPILLHLHRIDDLLRRAHVAVGQGVIGNHNWVANASDAMSSGIQSIVAHGDYKPPRGYP